MDDYEIAAVFCVIAAYFVMSRMLENMPIDRAPHRNRDYERHLALEGLYSENDNNGHKMLQLNRACFNSLCERLQERGLTRGLKYSETMLACGNIQKTGLTVDEDATAASEMDMSSQVQYSDTLLREGMHIYVDCSPTTSNEGGGSHTATSQPSSQSARLSKLPQKKRKNMEGGDNDVMEGMRLVMQNVADSLRERSEIKCERTEIECERIAVEASKNNALALTWDQICLAIDEIDVLDEEQKIAAMELFSQDGAENLKMFFLKMSTNKRASWLLKKLGDN